MAACRIHPLAEDTGSYRRPLQAAHLTKEMWKSHQRVENPALARTLSSMHLSLPSRCAETFLNAIHRGCWLRTRNQTRGCLLKLQLVSVDMAVLSRSYVLPVDIPNPLPELIEVRSEGALDAKGGKRPKSRSRSLSPMATGLRSEGELDMTDDAFEPRPDFCCARLSEPPTESTG